MTAYHYSTGQKRKHPIALLLHGCSGVFSNSDPQQGIGSLYKKRASRLNEQGYDVLLINSFSFRGADQNQCGNGDAGVSEVNDRPWDVLAAVNYLPQLAGVDTNNILLMGWSHGGSSVLATIQQNYLPLPANTFKAAVAYYPGCGLYGAFGGISQSQWVPNTPLLILHGDQDSLYTSGYCDQRINRAIQLGANQNNGNPITMEVYVGAQHSFDYAYSVGGKWTQADVDARSQAIVEWTDFYIDWL
tara:strand:- start:209 stop:943 length:735 start_codon:yes stop_codon:yes gene_type:complete